MNMKPKNTICLWFDSNAQEVARLYAATFPDSKAMAAKGGVRPRAPVGEGNCAAGRRSKEAGVPLPGDGLESGRNGARPE